MKNTHSFLFAVLIIGVMISCRKEKSLENGGSLGSGGDTVINSGNTEVGDWKFVSMHGSLLQTIEYAEAGIAVKAVTTSDYTTENNGGTIQFDGSKMTANGVTFSINTIAKTYVYAGGILADSVSSPLDTTVPAQTSTVDYTKIGTDSLYFPTGGLLDLGSGGTLPAIPAGCKLTFTGSLMTMTTVYDSVTTENNQGIDQKVTTHAVLVATLQKL